MTAGGGSQSTAAQRECMSKLPRMERDPDADRSIAHYVVLGNSSAPFRETIRLEWYLGRDAPTRTHRRAYRTTRYKLLAVARRIASGRTSLVFDSGTSVR